MKECVIRTRYENRIGLMKIETRVRAYQRRHENSFLFSFMDNVESVLFTLDGFESGNLQREKREKTFFSFLASDVADRHRKLLLYFFFFLV